MKALHQPVLLQPSIDALQVQPNHWYIDATFGRGGHTQEILHRGGKVLALDVDQEAIEWGKYEFAQEIREKQLILVRENFAKLHEVVEQNLEEKPQGVLFDFGTSADQLKDQTRGFSFEGEAELDMRMDDRLGVKAKDLLILLPEKQLKQLFIEYGGEENAGAIARRIVAEREQRPISTTRQLVELIEKVKRGQRGKLHPATKVFQALRIAVNVELESITAGLQQALELLPNQGRIVTIAFHEGEDRLAKHFFRDWENQGKGQLLTKHPIEPTEEEIAENPRSRSAKLRGFTKLSQAKD